MIVRFEIASPDGSGGADRVVVTGLPSPRLRELQRAGLSDVEWGRLLPVQIGPSPGDQPSILGDYSVVDGVVRFEPRFPFAAGEIYHARWIDAASGRTVASASARRELPVGGEPARVTAVYPSSPSLPENLLRLYVHFSRPMSRGEASTHLRLVGPSGEVERAFVAPEQELWNGARDRLTLLLDPGRIKRDVGPNLALGPVLARGSAYRLEIAPGWRDGQGRPTADRFVKTFEVVDADRERPRPESWTLSPPDGAMAPVGLRFEAPLDHGLLERAIRVEAGDGRELGGRVVVGAEERSWSFLPDEPWPTMPCRLVLAPELEDPSGNRVGRLFDEPMVPQVGGPSDSPVVLEFTVSLPRRG